MLLHNASASLGAGTSSPAALLAEGPLTTTLWPAHTHAPFPHTHPHPYPTHTLSHTHTPPTLLQEVLEKPVVAAFHAPLSFLAYRGGLWRASECDEPPAGPPEDAKVVDLLSHAVLVIGFNMTAQPPFWCAGATVPQQGLRGLWGGA